MILDEPANGLDVEGMAWLKSLLRSLADRGGTILVSSHMLNELETYADRAIIIDRGRLISERELGKHGSETWTMVGGPDLVLIERILSSGGLDYERHSDTCGREVIRVRETQEAIGDLMWRHRVRLSCLQRGSLQTLEAHYASIASSAFAADGGAEGP